MIYQIDPNETLCMALSGGGKGKTAISKTRKGKLTAQLPCSVFLDLHPENWLSIFKFVSLGQMVVVPQGASSRGWTEGKHVFTDVGQKPLVQLRCVQKATFMDKRKMSRNITLVSLSPAELGPRVNSSDRLNGENLHPCFVLSQDFTFTFSLALG